MLPKEPVILLSYINTQLRDNFSSLDELCRTLDADKKDICDRLLSIGYTYDREKNTFK
ncbi:MAG: DUF4250 domain-containing protein [Lachnospiraceae bacterium]|nr:DUF4250 domain-containing protein [Lachnospiraceae bacterium]